MEYIPHVVDCFSSWLHCLWQLLWMIIWNKLFQYVGLFLPFAVWVSVMFFLCFCHFLEINFVSWHFCLVSFGNFVASFFLFQYWFLLQNSAWSLWWLFQTLVFVLFFHSWIVHCLAISHGLICFSPSRFGSMPCMGTSKILKFLLAVSQFLIWSLSSVFHLTDVDC